MKRLMTTYAAALAGITALITALPATAAPAAAGQPGIDWTPAQIRAAFAPVRAGRKLLPKHWPGGAKVAVVLSFDVDNETWMIPNGKIDHGIASEYQYGATEGLPKVLKLLADRSLPATFFVPAAADMLAPETLPAITASGRNEVAIHGWVHEDVVKLNDAALEERLTRQAFDYLKAKTGKAPVGMRTGAWSASPYTITTAQKLGLLYDSSMMAMDDPYQLLLDGKDAGVIELPVTWILDDYPYVIPEGSLPDPERLFKVYREEFDAAYAAGASITLTFHPQLVGRRSRFAQLEALVDYMRGKERVWFTTAEGLARYVKANAGR